MIISRIIKSEVDYIKLDESIEIFKKENNRFPFIMMSKNTFEIMYKDGVFLTWTEPFSSDIKLLSDKRIVNYRYISCEVHIVYSQIKDGEIILL